MKGKNSLCVLVLLLFSFSFVIGAECGSDVDCDDGFACDSEGSCVEYCGLGETECSDGIDNDDDGLVDYSNCIFEDVTYFCNSIIVDEEFGIVRCKSDSMDVTCSLADGSFSYGDLECRSPYDTDESSNPQCADGIDNDSDGNLDYPFDSDCENPESSFEGFLGYAAPEYSLWDWIKSLFNF